MAAPTDFTELMALNVVLGAVGHAEVSALGSGTNAIVNTAESVLDEVNREIQSEGWWFNTETEVTYSPTANEILLTDEVLHADAHSDTDGNWVKRGGRLYNLDDHTFTFTADVELDVIKALDFTDMPLHSRMYIARRAARIMARRFLNDQQIVAGLLQEEGEARDRLVSENSRQQDANILYGNALRSAQLNRGGRGAIERGFF